MYFGRFGLMFALRMLDLVRFAYPLEAQTFGPTRQAQFAWLLLCASIVLLLLSPVLSIHYLSVPLSWTMVYIWSRKNRHIRVSFFGLVVMNAPYMPYFELMFTLLQKSQEVKDIVLGLSLGHLYYFFDELWPREYPAHGHHWLGPPQSWVDMFGPQPNS